MSLITTTTTMMSVVSGRTNSSFWATKDAGSPTTTSRRFLRFFRVSQNSAEELDCEKISHATSDSARFDDGRALNEAAAKMELLETRRASLLPPLLGKQTTS